MESHTICTLILVIWWLIIYVIKFLKGYREMTYWCQKTAGTTEDHVQNIYKSTKHVQLFKQVDVHWLNSIPIDRLHKDDRAHKAQELNKIIGNNLILIKIFGLLQEFKTRINEVTNKENIRTFFCIFNVRFKQNRRIKYNSLNSITYRYNFFLYLQLNTKSEL